VNYLADVLHKLRLKDVKSLGLKSLILNENTADCRLIILSLRTAIVILALLFAALGPISPIVKPAQAMLSDALDAFYAYAVNPGEVVVMWLGNGVGEWSTYASSGILLKTHEKVVLIDPASIISGQDVQKLQRLDILLITHEHEDHFSKSATISIQSKTGTVVVTNLGVYTQLTGSVPSEKLVMMSSAENRSLSGIEIRAIASIHPGNEPLTYVLLIGAVSVFHGSDSGFNSALNGYRGQARLALVPTGDPSPTASPDEALKMVKALGSSYVIPMHGTEAQNDMLGVLLAQQTTDVQYLRPQALTVVKIGLAGFDFSLSSSGGIWVSQGGSGSNIITVTLTSGTTQTVTLSASGVPYGASASFNPSSGNPTFNSTCTVSTSSSTPTGSYMINVNGTGGGLTCNTTFTLTVNPPQFGGTVTTVFTNTSYTLGFMMTGNIYDDSGIGFMYAHRAPPKVLFTKTDTSRVQASGQPTWLDYTHLVTVGGRNANPTTKYYEDLGLAPITFEANATHYRFLKAGIVQYAVLKTSITATNDYFVLEVATDGTHKVIILWGVEQYATYASGVYFDGVWTDLSSLTQAWYIVRWQDLDTNGVQDYPTEFIVVASGS